MTVMMLLFDASYTTMRSSKFAPIDIGLPQCRYRGWLITTKTIKGQLWMQWQHPLDSIPRYGCIIAKGDIAATLNHVRLLIDLSIELASVVLQTDSDN